MPGQRISGKALIKYIHTHILGHLCSDGFMEKHNLNCSAMISHRDVLKSELGLVTQPFTVTNSTDSLFFLFINSTSHYFVTSLFYLLVALLITLYF